MLRLLCVLLVLAFDGVDGSCQDYASSFDEGEDDNNDHPYCNICGSDGTKEITNLGGDVVFGDGNVVSTCEEAQKIGTNGGINPDLCAEFPDRVMFSCGCETVSSSSSASSAAVASISTTHSTSHATIVGLMCLATTLFV